VQVLYRIPYPYFFSQHDSVGGHIAHSLGIIGALVDEEHEVVVLAHEGQEEFEKVGTKFVHVPGEGTGMIRRQVWLYAFFRRSRQLLNDRAFDFTYTRYSVSATPQLWWVLSRETVPSVLEINSLGSQRIRLLNSLDAGVIRACTLPIVVSEALKGWIGENLGSSLSSRLRVVRNGVSSSRFRPIPEDRPEGTFRCAFAGLIKPDYGLECLVDAARSLPEDEVSFHIFGAGPFEADLRDYASGVQNFILEGEIPFVEVPDRLQEMDCLVYSTSSKWSFQSPTKLFEYMAVGRPIVAARTPQTEKILDHGRLGRLFELESPDSLREAVLDVRSSYDRALQRADEARQNAKEKHHWRFKVREIITALKRET
jgi:glycosyltransferase involved in cell wall biosynthesis